MKTKLKNYYFYILSILIIIVDRLIYKIIDIKIKVTNNILRTFLLQVQEHED